MGNNIPRRCSGEWDGNDRRVEGRRSSRRLELGRSDISFYLTPTVSHGHLIDTRRCPTTRRFAARRVACDTLRRLERVEDSRAGHANSEGSEMVCLKYIFCFVKTPSIYEIFLRSFLISAVTYMRQRSYLPSFYRSVDTTRCSKTPTFRLSLLAECPDERGSAGKGTASCNK